MTDHMSEQESGSRTQDSVIDYILNNRLKVIGYTWLAGVGGSLAYQWTRPIPTSLKVIHSRVYAQAITLGALAGVAGIELYAHAKSDEDSSSSK